MSDIKLFRTLDRTVSELEGRTVAIEKSLQSLVEQHLETFLGIRFLATEYSTGKTHSGRIDTLGIDENGCPVIIEFKRSLNENVINQGLFYLDWLMDHKAEFELLVQKQLGNDQSKDIEWSGPRLLCVAGAFTKYDEHAVQQINRNIELYRYCRYGEELLLLELVNAVSADAGMDEDASKGMSTTRTTFKTITEYLVDADEGLTDLFESFKAFCLGLGDDVQMKTLKYYLAFRRIKNFACVEIRIKDKHLLILLKIDPTTIELKEGFSRDVSNLGHYGTGDLELRVHTPAELEAAKPLILQSYEAS